MRISLAAARKNKKMTQIDLAKALNVSKKTVWSWENGKAKPRIDKIEPVCTVLGVSYDDIEWNA